MRYLIGAVSAGNIVDSVYRDPPAEPGTVEDALSNTKISQLDLASVPEAGAAQILDSELSTARMLPSNFRRQAQQ